MRVLRLERIPDGGPITAQDGPRLAGSGVGSQREADQIQGRSGGRGYRGRQVQKETKEEPTQEALPMEGRPIGWWWGAWPPQLPVCPPPVRPLPDREPAAR